MLIKLGLKFYKEIQIKFSIYFSINSPSLFIFEMKILRNTKIVPMLLILYRKGE